MTSKWIRLLLLLIMLVGLLTLPLKTQAADKETTFLLHKRIFRDLDMPENFHFRNDGHLIDPNTSQFMQTTFGLNDATFVVFEVTERYDELEAAGRSYDDIFHEDFNAKNLLRKDLAALADPKNERHETVKADPKYQFLLDDQGKVKLVAKGVTHTDTYQNLDGKVIEEDGLLQLKLPKKITLNGQVRDARYFMAEIDVGLTNNIDYSRWASYTILKFPATDIKTGAEFDGTVHLYPKNIGYARDPYFMKVGKANATVADTSAVPLEGAKFVLWKEIDHVKHYLDMSYESALQNVWISQNDLQGGTPLEDARVTVFTSQSNGVVTMEGRLLAAGTYYFEEVSAIPGYQIDATAQRIKVEVPRTWEDPVLVNGQPLKEPEPPNPQIGDEYMPLVYNYRDSVLGKKFQKVDLNNRQKFLPSAQFVVLNEDNQYLKQENGKNQWQTTTDLQSLTPQQATILISNANGNFEITGLPPGNYQLLEIKAPLNYQRSSDRINFTVDDGSFQAMPQVIVNAQIQPQPPNSNDPPKQFGFLPQTGNLMMNMLVIIGLVLSVWVVYIKIQQQRKR